MHALPPLFSLAFLLFCAHSAGNALSMKLDDFVNPYDSSSSSESSSDEDELVPENIVGWRPSECASGHFRASGSFSKCLPCTICGPDLYESESCKADRDTRCEWCLSQNAQTETGDFQEKCAQLVRLRDEFRRVVADRISAGGLKDIEPKAAVHFRAVPLDESSWWKAELAIEMAFYLALIALALSVIRFLCKASKPSYRTIQVNPPALDDLDQKNIIRAAESIRQKLGNKGYDRLEEEFI